MLGFINFQGFNRGSTAFTLHGDRAGSHTGGILAGTFYLGFEAVVNLFGNQTAGALLPVLVCIGVDPFGDAVSRSFTGQRFDGSFCLIFIEILLTIGTLIVGSNCTLQLIRVMNFRSSLNHLTVRMLGFINFQGFNRDSTALAHHSDGTGSHTGSILTRAFHLGFEAVVNHRCSFYILATRIVSLMSLVFQINIYAILDVLIGIRLIIPQTADFALVALAGLGTSGVATGNYGNIRVALQLLRLYRRMLGTVSIGAVIVNIAVSQKITKL